LALGLPIRGAISVGTALLDKERGIFIGTPLVEAVELEKGSDWIGMALGASWKSEALKILVPPDRVFLHQAPSKAGTASLFSELVLDWPRVWRETRNASAIDCLTALCRPDLKDDVRAKYTSAIQFYEHSGANENWFLPPGWTIDRPPFHRSGS